MFENMYTTKMSSSKRTLQKRFTKIRSKSGRPAKIMSFVTTAALAAALAAATAVAAAADNAEKNFFINGKAFAITPVLIENFHSTHTDSYYVPLRDTFEALGYDVIYDADKSKYSDMISDEIFPLFDNNDWDIFTDPETGEEIRLSNKVYNDWKRSLVTDNVDIYIYGATYSLNTQLPIIEMVKDGKTEFCQIGCWEMSYGYAAPPVLIGDRAYIPLRAVAGLVGGYDCVKWNAEKHDTYYEGALTFDEETLTVTIDL